MPKCRKITAHPAHLAILFQLVNQGEAGSIDALRTASRVLDAIDSVVCPPEDKWADWVDPELIRSQAEWERVKDEPQPRQGRERRFDPAARRDVVLTEDEYAHARRCFDKAIARTRGVDARSLLVLLDVLEKAEAVTAEPTRG